MLRLLALLTLLLLFSSGANAQEQQPLPDYVPSASAYPRLTAEDIPYYTVEAATINSYSRMLGWSPDGRWFVVTSSMGAFVYDALDLTQPPTLYPEVYPDVSGAFAPFAGAQLVVGSRRSLGGLSYIRLRDLDSGETTALIDCAYWAHFAPSIESRDPMTLVIQQNRVYVSRLSEVDTNATPYAVQAERWFTASVLDDDTLIKWQYDISPVLENITTQAQTTLSHIRADYYEVDVVQRVLLGLRDETLHVWSLDAPYPLLDQFPMPEQTIMPPVAFHRTQPLIAVEDGHNVTLWNYETGERRALSAEPITQGSRRISRIAFDRLGQRVAVQFEGNIVIYSIETQMPVQHLPNPFTDTVLTIDYDVDGTPYALTQSENGALTLRNMLDHTQTALPQTAPTFTAEGDFALRPSLGMIIGSTPDGLIIWHFPSGHQRTLQAAQFALSADGRRLLYSEGSQVALLDTDTDETRVLHTFGGGTPAAYIGFAGEDGNEPIAATPREVLRWTAEGDPMNVVPLVVSSSAQFLAASSDAAVYDASSGFSLALRIARFDGVTHDVPLEFRATIEGAQFSPDGTLLYVLLRGQYSSFVYALNAITGEGIGGLNGRMQMRASTDGRFMATWGETFGSVERALTPNERLQRCTDGG